MHDWPNGIDVTSLAESGWHPVPFNQFVIKVCSRCDLDCTYCYVYHSVDQGWRDQPRVMSGAVADATCDRIVEHATAHRLGSVRVVLHGGEPLLAPLELLERLADRLRANLAPSTALDMRVQTNGLTLTLARLDRLLARGIRIGLSIDGNAAAHDRSRIRADGSGSHASASAALARLSTRPGALTGLLCTIDMRNDPVEVFEHLIAYNPPVIDFLLPHGNWDNRPPGRPADDSTPYGDWLVAVFDRWSIDAGTDTRVRLFEEIIRLLCGRPSRSEVVGLSPSGVVVVETDGAIEQVDALKSAYPDAASTSRHVLRDSFDECLREPGVAARQIGAAALSPTCRACPIHSVCGGGYYPHRYRSGRGFLNPSVYCADLQRLIAHIRNRVTAALTAPAG